MLSVMQPQLLMNLLNVSTMCVNPVQSFDGISLTTRSLFHIFFARNRNQNDLQTLQSWIRETRSNFCAFGLKYRCIDIETSQLQ